jgi:tetratricopeptide (TPR) repeat protein
MPDDERRMTKGEGVMRAGEKVRKWAAGRRAGVLLTFSLTHLLTCLLLVSCASHHETPAQRAVAARAMLDETIKQFHTPSATVGGAERERLLDEAARRYADLGKKYPEQDFICAQALRGLGNIRAAQTNLAAAVQLYAEVARKYPQQDWEVLQAWKSAGDLLWDAGRRDEARTFYEKLTARFDRENTSAIVQTVVRGAKRRLAGTP